MKRKYKRNFLLEKSVTKHGLSKHPLYRVWIKIRERLYNPTHEAYHVYGGNGVIMCDEWRNSVKSFIEWALANGWEKGLHIDKDIIPKRLGVPAKIYSPEMCSIVTPKENCRNTSYNVNIEYNGKSQTLIEWCEELNMDHATLYHRLFDFGYSVEEAFTLPIGYNKNLRRFEYMGQQKTIHEWERFFGLKRMQLAYLVDKIGMSLEDAIKKRIK